MENEMESRISLVQPHTGGCPASTISLGRRQLFLPVNDNYLLTLRRRGAPAADADCEARPRPGFLPQGYQKPWRWESGKPAFPSAFAVGAVGMWESRLPLARFPRG